jgi:hypothetical protein
MLGAFSPPPDVRIVSHRCMASVGKGNQFWTRKESAFRGSLDDVRLRLSNRSNPRPIALMSANGRFKLRSGHPNFTFNAGASVPSWPTPVHWRRYSRGRLSGSSLTQEDVHELSIAVCAGAKSADEPRNELATCRPYGAAMPPLCRAAANRGHGYA